MRTLFLTTIMIFLGQSAFCANNHQSPQEIVINQYFPNISPDQVMNVYHHQLNDQQRQNINQALEANHPAIHPVDFEVHHNFVYLRGNITGILRSFLERIEGESPYWKIRRIEEIREEDLDNHSVSARYFNELVREHDMIFPTYIDSILYDIYTQGRDEGRHNEPSYNSWCQRMFNNFNNNLEQ